MALHGRLSQDEVAGDLGIRLAPGTLPGGQITGTFFESFGPGDGEEGVVRQAITGGTGRYEGARGQFIVGTESTTATPITIELVS